MKGVLAWRSLAKQRNQTNAVRSMSDFRQLISGADFNGSFVRLISADGSLSLVSLTSSLGKCA
jgi:hypothetical protein